MLTVAQAPTHIHKKERKEERVGGWAGAREEAKCAGGTYW